MQFLQNCTSSTKITLINMQWESILNEEFKKIKERLGEQFMMHELIGILDSREKLMELMPEPHEDVLVLVCGPPK